VIATQPARDYRHGQPGGYIWRDPGQLTAPQRAALATRDRRLAALDRATVAEPKRDHGAEALFREFRDQRMPILAAAEAVGVSERTARRYEARRRASQGAAR
jgi:hypothetical protein